MPLGAVSVAFDFVLARLLGGTPVLSTELLDACLRRVLWEGESASSSPEASRDEGWSMSAADTFASSDAAGRFLFVDPVDEGEDMLSRCNGVHIL